MKKIISIILLVVVICFGIFGCDSNTTNEDVKIEKISITESKNIIDVGEVITVYSTIVPYDSTNRNIQWESSDNTIITKKYQGLGQCDFIAVASGTAKVFAKALDGSYVKSNEIVVTVKGNGQPQTETILPKPFELREICHAGTSRNPLPENTLIAYKTAKQDGWKYVECDIGFTNDNVPVLLHDETINRTARNLDGSELTETIYLKDITLERLYSYDFGIYAGNQFAGEKIPTLEEFLILCKALGFYPYIELKAVSYLTKTQVEIVVDLVKKYGLIENASFICFWSQPLEWVLNTYKNARVGLVGSYSENTLGHLKTLLNITPNVFYDSNISDITNEIAEQLIKTGVEVEVWTAYNKEQSVGVFNKIPGLVGITAAGHKPSEAIQEALQ